jgi:predicted nucleotidyltransferase
MRSNAPALFPTFRSQHQAQLLSRLFLADAEVPMTDLARDLDTPLTTLHREAERLEEAGLLTSRRVGRTRLFRANTRHPAACALTELLTVTFGPAQVVAEEFAKLGADRVIIFGSWARRFAGERGHFPNDVDVLVIGDHALRSVAYQAADAAQRRLGFEVNTNHRTLAEWETAPYDALVAGIRDDAFVQVLPETQLPAGDLPREGGRSSADSVRLRRLIRSKRAQLEQALRRASVAEAYLFGSVARGTANRDSDIDIFVEYLPRVSDVDAYLTTGALIDELSEILGTRVDVLATVAAKPEILDSARKDMIALGEIS